MHVNLRMGTWSFRPSWDSRKRRSVVVWGTINGSDGCVQKDTQVWDGKTHLQPGPSQIPSRYRLVQQLLSVVGAKLLSRRQPEHPFAHHALQRCLTKAELQPEL